MTDSSERDPLHTVQFRYDVLQQIHARAKAAGMTTTAFLSEAVRQYGDVDLSNMRREGGPRVRAEVTNVRVHVPDDLWAVARRRATLERTTLSAVLAKLAEE